MPKKVIALCMNTEYRLVDTCCRFKESGCLGVQPKVGGKFLLKLNTGERPIANKYREGKMQRTLKRELKVLEIVKREAIGSSACCLSTHLLFEVLKWCN